MARQLHYCACLDVRDRTQAVVVASSESSSKSNLSADRRFTGMDLLTFNAAIEERESALRRR